MPDPNPPSLSPQAIADYRRLLADETFQHDYPQRYAMLKASVSGALAETNQSLDPPSDPRSPSQAYWDRQLGVEPRDPSDYELRTPATSLRTLTRPRPKCSTGRLVGSPG
jgi:hypothetical protein